MQHTERKIWRPYTQEKITSSPLQIDRASGSYLYTKDGQKIFDGIASWWVITHGHCHPAIAQAVAQQAERLDQVNFANFSHTPAEELAELLLQLTPAHLTKVFFTDNGSTAVESALKMALQACRQKGQEKKQKFIAFPGAYHGDTVGAMSVGSEGVFTRPYRSLLFEVLRAPHPLEDPQNFAALFKSFLETHHSITAGIILEPLIQAAGGMLMWPESAVQTVAHLCHEFGIYLIFDEVMTGFGRTGSLFAMDRAGVQPDLVCLSKGLTGGTLPLAVTLASQDLYEAFLAEEKSKMFFHGHSFTGNPISCAAAVANLHVFKNEKTIDKLQAIESVHRTHLQRGTQKGWVQQARVCGTVAAFEIASSEVGYSAKMAEALTQQALARGLFIRPLGNTVYLLPPYSSTQADLENAWNVLEEIITS